MTQTATDPAHSDPEAAAAAFARALERAAQPGEAYAALQYLAQALIGARLFTVMEVSGDAMFGERIFSNQPGAYPVAGIVPLKDNAWYDTAIRRQAPFIANDAAGIAAVFADHELIASLGCASVLNLPILLDGRLVATINLLDRAGHYDAARVARAIDDLTVPAQETLRAERRLRAQVQEQASTGET